MKKIGILALFVSISILTIGQDKKKARYYFEDIQDYASAADEYFELLKEDPDNLEYNYNIAISYLNSNIDKSLAIPYLEKLAANEEVLDEAKYYLGRAYALGYQFNKAIDSYKKYLENATKNDPLRDNAERQIEYCQNAKELMKFPLSVEFENLGREVNSKFDDYFPFIPLDESYIIYNSKRGINEAENETLPQPDIMISHVKKGKYTDAEKMFLGIDGGRGKEEIVGLNAAGTEAIFYFETLNNGGDLYECKLEDNTFGEPVKLDRNINSKAIEISACISSDNSRLYFASDRPGGYGGVDLYLCQRLPNGKWSEAQNLGASVNTKYDEDFPNISPDGKELYFSSKGHTSMGGYDIYKAKWDAFKKKFVGAKNLGYPINTPEDNMNFRVSENGKYGYISALRKGGQGGLDIYRVNFNEVEPNYTAISGRILSKNGNESIKNLFIQIVDAESDEVYGDYQPDERTQRYVMILPPGNYIMYVEADGYKMMEEDIEVLDKVSFRNYLHNDIMLIPTK